MLSACRFTSQLPQLGILGRTIGRAVPQVFVFFLISFVIFLAFAQCFFMAYYASVEGYQSYQASIMSVLRFTVLDFDYDALSNVRRHPALPTHQPRTLLCR
jgi:dolichyl-phosphate-mannose--protein O-mannosyl transferase